VKRNLFFSLLLAATCLLLGIPNCIPASKQPEAREARTAKEYYEGVRRGWYWYEKEPPKEKKTKEEAEKAQKEPAFPPLSTLTNQQLWEMHPDDFQKLYDHVKKQAVQNPTPQNIGDWIRITDIGRRKALAFTTAVSLFLQKNPEYDASTFLPDAEPGKSAQFFGRKEELESYLKKAQGNYGLIYFYSPNCKYCDAQTGILQWFRRIYGWDIESYDVTANKRIADFFGVTITPSLFIISRKTGNTMPISAGVITVDELSTRLYRSIRVLSGEVQPEEYNTWQSDLIPFMKPLPPPEPKFKY